MVGSNGRRKFGAAEPFVKIANASGALKTYVLAEVGGKPVYSSSTRALENAPSDDFAIELKADGQPLGRRCPNSFNCLATVKERLYPRPTISEVSGVDGLGGLSSFEGNSDNLYIVGATLNDNTTINISKWQLADPPVFRSAFTELTLPFISGDRIGAPPAYLYSARMAGYHWMLPVNNGTRMMVLDAIGAGAAADTWTLATIDKAGTGEDGAKFLMTLPSGKGVRAVADNIDGGFGFTSLANARISILPAGSDAETVGNWGAGFPVGAESLKIVSLTAFDELIVVGKTDGYYAAVVLSDGSLDWRTLLPDAWQPDYGATSWAKPIVWHNWLLLPTPNELWMHDLQRAIPAGPETSSYIFEDEVAFDGITPRFGTFKALAHGGKWLYGLYMRGSGASSVYYLMAAREREAGDEGEGPLAWFVINKIAAGIQSLGEFLHIQRNGTGGPQILFGRRMAVANDTLYHMRLGQDRGPYRKDGHWGEISGSGDHWFEEHQLPSSAVMREAVIEIGESDANLVWSPIYTRDGGAVASLTGTTISGSVFWTPGGDDQSRRWFFGIRWAASGSWTTSKARVPHFRRMTIHGTFIPDVGDALLMVVDVAATVQRRGGKISEKAIYDELKALRNPATAAARAFVDVFGVTGTIIVQSTEEKAPSKMAALEHREVMTLRGILQEYA